MKKIAILAIVLLLTGCTGMLKKLPQNEFDSFVWDRTGNATQAKITATDAKMVDGELKIGKVVVVQHYGPFWELRVDIEGLKIKIDEDKKD